MVDPALSTLQHHFTETVCTTTKGDYYEGKKRCSWSSCREGCTHEVFKCIQIEVTYMLNTTSIPGKLYPNVKGCGYPPKIDCKEFANLYTEAGRTFNCFFSQKDPELVITQLDYDEVQEVLLYSIALPLPIFVFSIVYLIFAYLYIYKDNSKVGLLCLHCVLETREKWSVLREDVINTCRGGGMCD